MAGERNPGSDRQQKNGGENREKAITLLFGCGIFFGSL